MKVNNISEDPFRNDTSWAVIDQKQVNNDQDCELIYQRQRKWTWQLGQVIWAALQTICTLGLALAFACTRRTWQQAISGCEKRTVIIANHNPRIPTPPRPDPEPPKIEDPVPPRPTPPVDVTPKVDPQPRPVVPPPPRPALPVAPPRPVDRYASLGINATTAAFLKRIDDAEVAINKVQAEVGKKSLRSINTAYQAAVPIAELTKVFHEMIAEFSKPEYQTQYNYNPFADAGLLGFRPGQQVEAYFANATNGESDYSKKFRSLAGLFNLLIFGGEIMDELRARFFIEGEHHYPTAAQTGTLAGEGLNKMKFLTGNTVDLCVQLSTRDDATGHVMSSEEVRKAAQNMIDGFKDLFAEFRIDPARRIIDLAVTGNVFPQATNNLDRGNYPIWTWSLQGTNTKFHVNVPDITDVFGAVLLAPMRLAQTFVLLKSLYRGKELNEKLHEFFGPRPGREDTDAGALSTRCFNMKWNAILNFSGGIRGRLDMIAKCGGVAAFEKMQKDALSEGDMQNNLMLDEAILPPENSSRKKALDEAAYKTARAGEITQNQWDALRNTHSLTIDQWKALAKERYIQKAKSMGMWGKLFNNTDQYGRTTYAIIDERIINQQMARLVTSENGYNRWSDG